MCPRWGDLPSQAPPLALTPGPAINTHPNPGDPGLGLTPPPGCPWKMANTHPRCGMSPCVRLSSKGALQGLCPAGDSKPALTVGPGGELDRPSAAGATSTPLFPSYVGARDTEGTDTCTARAVTGVPGPGQDRAAVCWMGLRPREAQCLSFTSPGQRPPAAGLGLAEQGRGPVARWDNDGVMAVWGRRAPPPPAEPAAPERFAWTDGSRAWSPFIALALPEG